MNIGLLIGRSLSEGQLRFLEPIFSDDTLSIGLVIIDDSPKKSLYQNLKKNIKRGRGGYIIVMFFREFIIPKQKTYDVELFCNENNIPFIKIDDLYKIEAINKIRTYKLDVLILSGGFGIIKEPLLSLCSRGIISYHHGNMRKYRGQPPAFWELYNGESEMGITVQKLSAGLDCGIPIVEKTIKIFPKDTLVSLNKRSNLESGDMMYKALKEISAPNYKPNEINEFGKVYTLPNLKQWSILNLKVLWRMAKNFV